jgi:putative endonuclease
MQTSVKSYIVILIKDILHPKKRCGVDPAPFGVYNDFMYYVYIIKSCRTNEIYIGFTNDLKRRIDEHNKQQALSTKSKTPWHLIYYEAYTSEKDAILRENGLKHYGRALAMLKNRIKNSLIENSFLYQIPKPQRVRG